MFIDGKWTNAHNKETFASYNPANAELLGQVPSGGKEDALAGITAKAVIMPSSTDQYFWSDDSRDEVSGMSNAKLTEIPSIWGHAAGLGFDPADKEFIDSVIRKLID